MDSVEGLSRKIDIVNEKVDSLNEKINYFGLLASEAKRETAKAKKEEKPLIWVTIQVRNPAWDSTEVKRYEIGPGGRMVKFNSPIHDVTGVTELNKVTRRTEFRSIGVPISILDALEKVQDAMKVEWEGK